MEQLNNEVVEAQKLRADLLKWKIVIVAALGATGLGFVDTGASGRKFADLVLCLIPLAAVYVDLAWAHLKLRIAVIGEFRAATPGSADLATKQYEEWVNTAVRDSGVLGLEKLAVFASSFAFSAALILVALIGQPALPHRWAVLGSGAVGVVLAAGVHTLYDIRQKRLEEEASILKASRRSARPSA